ncbi:hypothetical protein AVEN_266265-1 [Araneus ventricosus]|uniref:Uncharacterized protein n=1 Tax=Araneus ventricosus TaxID=182803 RepID=A0A4Y2G6C2_ARAVE|nr:hypothetical protein AVEN_266265-1 [Araneus ventricosus]
MPEEDLTLPTDDDSFVLLNCHPNILFHTNPHPSPQSQHFIYVTSIFSTPPSQCCSGKNPLSTTERPTTRHGVTVSSLLAGTAEKRTPTVGTRSLEQRRCYASHLASSRSRGPQCLLSSPPLPPMGSGLDRR